MKKDLRLMLLLPIAVVGDVLLTLAEWLDSRVCAFANLTDTEDGQ